MKKYLITSLAALLCINVAQAQEIHAVVPFDITMSFGDTVVVNYDMQQAEARKISCSTSYDKVWVDSINGDAKYAGGIPLDLFNAQYGGITTGTLSYVDNRYVGTVIPMGIMRLSTVSADNGAKSFKLQCSYQYKADPV